MGRSRKRKEEIRNKKEKKKKEKRKSPIYRKKVVKENYDNMFIQSKIIDPIIVYPK